MNHIQMEIRIEAPIERVWAFLCDTSRWHDWIPRQETLDWSGPYDQVGTTYVSKVKLMGFDMKQTCTVVEVEPLKLIHEHNDTPMDTYYRFAPEGDATRLIVEADYDVPGHIPGFMTKSFFERQTRNMLEDFKALAEARVPVSS